MRSQFDYDAFISHSSKDKSTVAALIKRLSDDGVRVWVNEIAPGEVIARKIEQAIDKSRCFVLVMSRHALDSNWVSLERYTAISRDPANETGRFITVRLDDADIGDMLNQFAYVDWREQSDEQYANLLAAIQQSKPRRDANLGDVIDPDWRQKLDRIEQTATAHFLVNEMLELGRPRCICFCWYGGAQDGVDVFHDRLVGEFDKRTKNRCWSVRPEWPGAVNRQSFCEMLTHTLDVANPADVGSALRNHFHGRRRQLLYVNHTPVASRKRLDPHQLLLYLRWWDEAVLDYMEPQQHVVLGVSFVVENAVRFRHAVETVVGIPRHPFSDRFVFKMLPVLKPLEEDDIRTFFKRINMQLRFDQQLQEQAVKATGR